MNKQCFKTVFSKRLGCLVAVGEHAASQGKANGAGQAGGAGAGLVQFVGLLAAGFASVSLAWAQPASNALPTGGVVAQGAASVSTSGAVMNIQQSTAKAVLNWQSFDIGSAARVNIVQPGADAVMLNRVTGANPSQIFGQLSANGQVVLVNPNGVLFGKDGSVSASSFTASTLGISDANFMAGNLQFERNGSTAGVVNQGSIKATGGYVALLGASVSNQGRIETHGGAALLGAAETVKVPLGSSGRIKLELTPSAINAAVSNSKDGTIVTHGGQVYMQAAALNTAVASILQSGSIDTTGEQGGAVHVLADGGNIRVSGSIKANSNDGTAGGDIYIGRDKETNVLAAVGNVSGATLESKGGFVETSGQFLATYGTRVMAKDWLLDPFNITIGPGNVSNPVPTYSDYTATATSTIFASDIVENLKTTNVKISTGLGTIIGTGDAGNITVAENILKEGAANTKLTLEANNRIIINSGIKISDTSSAASNPSGKLSVDLIAKGAAKDGSSLVMAANSKIDVGGAIDIKVDGAASGNNNAAFYMFAGSQTDSNLTGTLTTIKGGSVSIDANLSGTNVTGMFARHGILIQSTDATTGKLEIKTTHTGTDTTGTGMVIGSDWSSLGANSQSNPVGNPTGPLLKSASSLTLKTITANTKADGGIAFSDTHLQAVGDVSVIAESQKIDSVPIFFGQTFGTNTRSISSSVGSVLIQANQGSVVLKDLGANAITGKNITIDNTNGTVSTPDTNGLIVLTKGKGSSTNTTWAGVLLLGTSADNVVATGNLNVAGASTAEAVVVNGVAKTRPGVEQNVGIKGANVSVEGSSLNGTGVYSTGNVTSTGEVSVIGKSTGTSGGAGAVTLGIISAVSDVKLQGYSANTADTQGLVIQNAVTTSGGKITVTGETNAGNPGQRAVALAQNGTVYGSLKVADGKTININANTLFVNTGSSVDAGATGTVNIKTLTSGNDILIGGGIANDVMSTSLGSQKLGIDNTELSRIKAGNLVIGDTASTGMITIAASTTTLSQTGNITLQTGGNILVDKALTLDDSKTLTLKAGGTVTDNDTTGVIKASKLELLGSNAVVTLDSKQHEVGTLAADVKSLKFSNKTALMVGTVNTINSVDQPTGTVGITAKEGVNVTTEKGDLSLNKAISNSTSGNVVVGAGVSKIAGDSSDGNVKTTDGIGITNNNGKTLVYSGSASGTGKLSYLNSSLANLVVNGLETQNADTNVDFNSAPLGIAGSTANAQVMFREKLTFSATDLASATLNKKYADDSTANGQSAALFTEAILALKAANNGNIVTGAVNDANRISVAKSAVIDSLTGNLPTATTDYSSSNFLKAKPTAYEFSALTGDKYTTNVAAGALKVAVAQRALTGTVGAVSTTYGINAATGAVTVNNVKDGDKLTTSADAVQLTGGQFSSSGNRSVGRYLQTAALSPVSGSGADAGNYTAGTASSNNYVVTPKAISATVTAADKVYDGNAIAALQATSANILPGDQVSVGGLTGTFASKNVARDASGNVVAQAVTVSGSGANLGGNDGANYVLSNAASIAPTSARITPKDLTVTGITASDKVYDGTTAATIAVGNAALAGVVSGDAVSLAGQAASGNFASKNVAFDGTGAVASQSVQVAGLTLGGSDARNYTLTGQTSAQAKILQRAVTIAGSVAQDKSYDGNTTATVVPGQLSNLVTGESLNVSAAGTFADAEVGSNKVVNATYRLANGTNGLASNYTLTNASEVLRAAILSANRNPLSPIITPSGGTGSTRVVISGSGSSGAAVGVADDEISNRQECSVLHPEKCECEESTIPGIEMCYAPNVSLNNKD